MPFRNEDVASRARIDTLEREVERLRDENEALRSRPLPSDGVARPGSSRLPDRITLALGLVLLVGGWAFWALVEKRAPGDPVVSVALTGAGVVLVAVGITLHLIRKLLVMVPPGELAVVVGRQHVTDGVQRGYRVLTAGRSLRLPILESVERMPTRLPTVELTVARAFARGGDAVGVDVRAGVEIAAGEPSVHNAIERFMGREPHEIARVAHETIEGSCRTVAARLTADEMRSDPAQLGRMIVEECEPDMRKLGLRSSHLEVLSVHSS